MYGSKASGGWSWGVWSVFVGRVYEFAQILDEKHVSIQKHRLKIRLYFLLLNGENYELLLEEGPIQVGKRNIKNLCSNLMRKL